MEGNQNINEESRYFILDNEVYISKTGNFYRLFRPDGTEITEALIPLNICIMSLNGMLHGAVRVFPAKEEMDIEPGLKELLEKIKH